VLASSSIRAGNCYPIPAEFNDQARSFLLYPQGSAAVGLRLYTDYGCMGANATVYKFYESYLPPPFFRTLSSCTEIPPCRHPRLSLSFHVAIAHTRRRTRWTQSSS
jgi:hypothetical protein